MKKILFIFMLALITMSAAAQKKVTVFGSVVDKEGAPMPYSTVSILFPADSTLAFFGITNADGDFKIDQVVKDNYVLQASYLGFAPHFQNIAENQLNDDLNIGPIVLELKAIALDGVEINGVQTPILIKGDTIEYNASSFRAKPTDNVEMLLKKMPGIEVDREGKITAQGEEVTKVTVDGEEFFGNDPKMATKNLPADAVKKVQVFDKKSDAAEFTGVDDGERTKTINLELKEDKKKGTFGDLKAGYGTNDRYELGASLFRYSKKLELSGIAKLNNINDFGFSISDYLNYQGFGGMGSGNMNFRINSNSTSPINFGQAQYGNLLSGAGGLNGNYKIRKDNVLNFSYMINGSDRTTETTTNSTQFTPQGSFNIDEYGVATNDNLSHAGTVKWKNDLDSLTRIIMYGSANLTDAGSRDITSRTTSANGNLVNSNDRDLNAASDGYNVNATATIIRKSAKKAGRNVTGAAEISLSESTSGTNWENNALIPPNTSPVNENYFRDDLEEGNSAKVSAKWNEPMFKNNYLELGLSYFNGNNTFTRNQHQTISDDVINASPTDIAKQDRTEIQGEVNWKINTDETSFSVGLGVQDLSINQGYTQAGISSIDNPKSYTYLLPSLRYRRSLGQGKRVSLRYNTDVSYANISTVAPFIDISNPLFINQGNLDLEPEYKHSGNLFFMLHDAFSFTSLFLHVNGSYTENSIIQSKSIDNNLLQTNTPINYKDQKSVGASLNFSTPIKPIGLMFGLDLSEDISSGYSLINDQENKLDSYTHEIEVSLSNRKKDLLDFTVGSAYAITQSKYSVQSSQNANYYTNTYFAELSIFLNEKWVFNTTFDYQLYRNSQFGNSVAIPLLQAEITRNFLQNNRGSLTLKMYDILNKNQGVEQFASQNYISQTVSNVLRQYAMLSFTYKLKAAGKKPMGDMDIHIRRR